MLCQSAEGIQLCSPWNERNECGRRRPVLQVEQCWPWGRRAADHGGCACSSWFGDNQEAISQSTTRVGADPPLGMSLEEQWPALKLVGFGFYYARGSGVVRTSATCSCSPPPPPTCPPGLPFPSPFWSRTLALGVALVLLLARGALSRGGSVGQQTCSLICGVAVVVGAATRWAPTHRLSLGGRCELYNLIVSAALTGAGTFRSSC